MEVDELVCLKIQLEQEVFSQVAQLCKEFSVSTGLDVTNVLFATQDVTCIGDEKPKQVLTHCSITVGI